MHVHHDHVLDFHAQAEQMMQIIEARLANGNREAALQYLKLKFKTLYEQGVRSGRLYERDGTSPY